MNLADIEKRKKELQDEISLLDKQRHFSIGDVNAVVKKGHVPVKYVMKRDGLVRV